MRSPSIASLPPLRFDNGQFASSAERRTVWRTPSTSRTLPKRCSGPLAIYHRLIFPAVSPISNTFSFIFTFLQPFHFSLLPFFIKCYLQTISCSARVANNEAQLNSGTGSCRWLLPSPRQLHRVFVVQLAACHRIEIFRYNAVPANAE